MDYYEDDRSRVFFSRSVMIKTPVDGETPSAFVTAAASAPQIASPFSETSTLAANILSSRESTTTPDTRTTRNESTTRNGSTSREASAPKAPTAFRDSSIARKPLPPVPQIHPSVQNSIGMTTPEHSPNPNPSKGPFGQSYEDAIEIEHSRRLAAERQQEKWERINQLQERSSSRTMGESGGSPDPDPNRGPLGQSYEDAIEIERSRRLAAERQQEKWERTNQLQGRSRTWGESGGSQIVNNIFNPISQSTAYHSIHGTNSNYDRRVVREEMVPLTPLIDNGEVEESGDLGYRRHRSHHGVVVDANEQPSAEEEARLRHLYFPRENSSLDSNDPSFKKFEGAIGEGWDGPNDPENPANFSDKKSKQNECLYGFVLMLPRALDLPQHLPHGLFRLQLCLPHDSQRHRHHDGIQNQRRDGNAGTRSLPPRLDLWPAHLGPIQRDLRQSPRNQARLAPLHLVLRRQRPLKKHHPTPRHPLSRRHLLLRPCYSRSLFYIRHLHWSQSRDSDRNLRHSLVSQSQSRASHCGISRREHLVEMGFLV